MGVLVVENIDVHFWPWQRFHDPPLSPLHVQAEVVHCGVAEGKEDRVEWEAGNPGI